MIQLRFRSTTAFAMPLLGAALALAPCASAQQSDKAAAPPVDPAASQSGVATKQPAKSGSQSGKAPPQAEAASAAQGNKAGKPPTADDAARSGVATKKPAKEGAQAGPASAPAR